MAHAAPVTLTTCVRVQRCVRACAFARMFAHSYLYDEETRKAQSNLVVDVDVAIAVVWSSTNSERRGAKEDAWCSPNS